MFRKSRIANFLLAGATFGLGVFTAGLLSESSATPSHEAARVEVRVKIERCTDASPHSERFFLHTEKERRFEDRIYETKKRLGQLEKWADGGSSPAERKMAARERQLRAQLDELILEYERYWLEERERSDLGYVQVCYEQ